MATNQLINPPSDNGNLESALQPNTNTPFPILKMAKHLQLDSAKHNFIFSPCSIQLAMSLIAHGAKGSTLDELLSFSQVETLDQLTSIASKLVATLNQPQTDPDDSLRGHKVTSSGGHCLDNFLHIPERRSKITFVGGAWIDHSLSLSPNFVSCAENIYKVKAEAVNFKDQAEEVLNKVNKWAADSTGGLIKSILTSLEPDSRFVIANALHFKGTWDDEFSKSATRNSDFYLHNGETVQVPFMCSSKDRFIQTFDDVKVLRLPYRYAKEAAFSMYIILPHQRGGLWSLVDKLGSDPNFLGKYTTNIDKHVEVGKLMVPKFKITCDFEASQFLKGVGLKSCFSMKAELHNMLLNPKLGVPLYVSKVHHKSYIKIDEDGTEAAAITALEILCGSAGVFKPRSPVVDFVADHPFMFMIKDDHSGMVLFLGHVINPLLI